MSPMTNSGSASTTRVKQVGQLRVSHAEHSALLTGSSLSRRFFSRERLFSPERSVVALHCLVRVVYRSGSYSFFHRSFHPARPLGAVAVGQN